jgi:hypothetical protein
MHAATSKVENSPQGSSCKLKFVHAYNYLIQVNIDFLKWEWKYDENIFGKFLISIWPNIYTHIFVLHVYVGMYVCKYVWIYVCVFNIEIWLERTRFVVLLYFFLIWTCKNLLIMGPNNTKS